MKIYVQSAGFAAHQDYLWTEVLDGNELKEIENQFDRPPYKKIDGVDYLELYSFTLVLSRSSRNLCLLISGLPSGRTDFRNRNIRNTVMWEFDAEDPGQIEHLQELAIIALSDRSTELNERIKKAIPENSNNEYGYSADKTELNPEKLIENIQVCFDPFKVPEKGEIFIEGWTHSHTDTEDIIKSIKEGEKDDIIVTDNRTQATVNEKFSELGVISKVKNNNHNFFESINNIVSRPWTDSGGFVLLKFPKKNHYRNLYLIFISILSITSIYFWNRLNFNNQPSEIIALTDFNISMQMTKNKISFFDYTLTGNYNLPATAPAIEEVKLIDSQQQSIATGKVNSKDQGWQIIYQSESQIDCKQQLSIQGYDREGKSVGEAIEIPSICSDVN